MKRLFTAAAITLATAGGFAAFHYASAGPAAPKNAEVWKEASCGCCTGWVTYLEQQGYQVTVHEVDDLAPMKDQLKIPEDARSCHTAKIGGYVVEGHVPVEAIDKLLTQRPKGVVGIASPGMPMGSPGMDGPKQVNTVVSFGDGPVKVVGRY